MAPRLTKAQREAAAAAAASSTAAGIDGSPPPASTSSAATGAAVVEAPAEDEGPSTVGDDTSLLLGEDEEAAAGAAATEEEDGNRPPAGVPKRGAKSRATAPSRAKPRSSGVASASAAAAARESPSLGAAEDNDSVLSATGKRARSASESEMSTSEGSSAGDEEDQLAAGAGAAGDDSRLGDGLGDEDDSMLGGAGGGGTADSPEVKCMWEDCGVTFTSLQPFINHLHDDHVGIHKARYACEWTGCPRKGKAQTSRFALLSHLRSHTGEKPFTCPRPECDKSFTRSDALAKHMRVQHNINPTTSRGRGSAKDTTQGSGGRASRVKGEEDDDWASGSAGAEGGVGYGAAGQGGDTLDDELLGLAEGGPTSAMDMDQSLTLHGATSAAFTYENLFETVGATSALTDAKDSKAAARAVDGTASGDQDGPLSIVAGMSMTDEELGIVRDNKISSNLLLNDDDIDEEAVAKERREMDQVLEMGRREWVRREREKAKIRAEEEKLRGPRPEESATGAADEEMADVAAAETNGKRAIGAAAYDSEEETTPGTEKAGAAAAAPAASAATNTTSASKRPRRSSQRNTSLYASSHLNSSASSLLDDSSTTTTFGTTRSASKSALATAKQAAEANKLSKAYLIEKAKWRVIKEENARLQAELDRLRMEEKWEKEDKRKLLERCLEAELGRDVGAIFSPPPSPSRTTAP